MNLDLSPNTWALNVAEFADIVLMIARREYLVKGHDLAERILLLLLDGEGLHLNFVSESLSALGVCLGVNGSSVLGVNGSSVLGVNGSSVLGVNGSSMLGVNGSSMLGVNGSSAFGVNGSNVGHLVVVVDSHCRHC